MKYVTWIVVFAVAAIVNTIVAELDVAYTLAAMISPDSAGEIAVFAGLFSGIFAVIIYGFAFYFAQKINRHREKVRQRKNAGLSGTVHITRTQVPPVAAAEPEQTASADPAIERKAAQAPSKQRYCKFCGGAIDSQSKKCTKCHKQYLRITRNGAMICCLCFAILMLVNVIVYQNIHYEGDTTRQNNQITELEAEIEELQQQVSFYEGKIYFYDQYVVFVSDDGTNKYHRLGCENFDDSYFWAYNVELAEAEGYSPCSKCNED